MKYLKLTTYILAPIILVALGLRFTQQQHELFGSALILIGYFWIIVCWVRGALDFAEE